MRERLLCRSRRRSRCSREGEGRLLSTQAGSRVRHDARRMKTNSLFFSVHGLRLRGNQFSMSTMRGIKVTLETHLGVSVGVFKM